MRTIRPMTGKHLANWLRKKGAEDLGAVFEDTVAEAYDHLKLDTAASRLAMLETLEKRWRNKRCAIVTIVLEPK